MRRGDVVTAVFPDAYGKPRPALLIQADVFEALPSVTLLPITSDIRDLPPLRIDIDPGLESGLRRSSQIMVDKAQTIPRAKLGNRLGCLSEEKLHRVDEALGRFLGLQ